MFGDLSDHSTKFQYLTGAELQESKKYFAANKKTRNYHCILFVKCILKMCYILSRQARYISEN